MSIQPWNVHNIVGELGELSAASTAICGATTLSMKENRIQGTTTLCDVEQCYQRLRCHVMTAQWTALTSMWSVVLVRFVAKSSTVFACRAPVH